MAIRMLMQTGNIYYVQQLLGHQNIKTTMICVKFSPELLRSVLQEKPGGNQIRREA